MRVNMQAGFYKNLYNAGNKYNILNGAQFKGKNNTDNSSDKFEKTGEDIMEDTDDELFDNQTADEMYEEGYRDGRSEKLFNRALLGGLAIMGIINAHSNYTLNTSLENMRHQQQIQYDTLSGDIDKKLEDLAAETYLNDKTLLEAIVDIMFMIEDLKNQENTLKEQIEALPQDSEESQALKEELHKIEEQYKILEEKYWDYISEYNSQNNDNDSESDEKPADDFDFYFDGPTVKV